MSEREDFEALEKWLTDNDKTKLNEWRSHMVKESFIGGWQAATKQSEASKWISVNDILPEVGDWYLIYSHDSSSTMAFLDSIPSGTPIWLAHNDTDLGEWENVTHWQPLPEPPKELL
ncbi:MAG: DUF551 domain-containing protein [Paludibacter sp.]|nr:DUF551 domain-containing protein [Paludibacter sp.]